MAVPKPDTQDITLKTQNTIRTVVYKTVDNLEIKADVYTHVAKGIDSNTPVVLYFHGGAVVGCNRQWLPAHVVQSCLKRGWVLVSADFRQLPQVTGKEIVKDAQVYNPIFKSTDWITNKDRTHIPSSETNSGEFWTTSRALNHVSCRTSSSLDLAVVSSPVSSLSNTLLILHRRRCDLHISPLSQTPAPCPPDLLRCTNHTSRLVQLLQDSYLRRRSGYHTSNRIASLPFPRRARDNRLSERSRSFWSRDTERRYKREQKLGAAWEWFAIGPNGAFLVVVADEWLSKVVGNGG